MNQVLPLLLEQSLEYHLACLHDSKLIITNTCLHRAERASLVWVRLRAPAGWPRAAGLLESSDSPR